MNKLKLFFIIGILIVGIGAGLHYTNNNSTETGTIQPVDQPESDKISLSSADVYQDPNSDKLLHTATISYTGNTKLSLKDHVRVVIEGTKINSTEKITKEYIIKNDNKVINNSDKLYIEHTLESKYNITKIHYYVPHENGIEYVSSQSEKSGDSNNTTNSNSKAV